MDVLILCFLSGLLWYSKLCLRYGRGKGSVGLKLIVLILLYLRHQCSMGGTFVTKDLWALGSLSKLFGS